MERGAGEMVVWVSCSMGRFKLHGVFVAIVGLLRLLSGCLSFVGSFIGIGGLCGVW